MINPKLKILNSYTNGGYVVTIYEDGTKVRKQISHLPPRTPESIDLKITNYCNLSHICKWCHENSDVNGDNGNLNKISRILKDLPAGSELAIGGGNPLAHPDLFKFLETMQERGIICNLTINQRHVNAFKSDLTSLITNDLIKGLGISKSGQKSVAWLFELTNNIVFHVIAGINKIDEILMLPKVLILGYKNIGRGHNYKFNNDVNINLNLKKWRREIQDYLGNNTISFDNLALEQLHIQKHLTPELWDSIYMGEDATFTYYIDAVKQRFGQSSTSGAPYSLMDNSADMLKYIRYLKTKKEA